MADLTQQDWQNGYKSDKEAVILDVRTDAEVAFGLIPGEVHIDIYKGYEFLEQVKLLDREKHYYVYCRVGERSGQACNIMQQLGFKYTYNLMGGMEQWHGPVTTKNED